MSLEPRASIDIGSNTFRLLIATDAALTEKCPWQTHFYTHRIVRLGEGLHHTGKLSDNGMDRAIGVLHEFAGFLKEYDVPANRIFAVATAAMRDAANGEAFRLRVLHETGIDIRIIDGETEAGLSLAGSSAVLASGTRGDMLLFDIGGGSTEFVRAKEGKIVDAVSRKLGVVRLIEAHLKSDPPSAEDYAAMQSTAAGHLAEVEKFWRDERSPMYLVGTAGTVTTLAATQMNLYPYDAEQVNNHSMRWQEFVGLKKRLLGMSHAERSQLNTIEPGRADLIIGGLAIIESIMERWHYPALITVDAGLLEGVWLKAES